MPEMKSYKETSRISWGTSTQAEKEDLSEKIKLGSLQRIADASEKMAGSVTSLMDSRDRYKEWYETERRRCIALRGQITKLKKQLAAKG